MNEAELRGIDIETLRREAYPVYSEAKLRNIDLRRLRFEAAPVDFRLTVEVSQSVVNRKLEHEFTEQQFQIALDVLERKNIG